MGKDNQYGSDKMKETEAALIPMNDLLTERTLASGPEVLRVQESF